MLAGSTDRRTTQLLHLQCQQPLRRLHRQATFIRRTDLLSAPSHSKRGFIPRTRRPQRPRNVISPVNQRNRTPPALRIHRDAPPRSTFLTADYTDFKSDFLSV